jgi:hypothetical protein
VALSVLQSFDCYRLGKVAGEVDVQSLSNSKPVCNELQWDDIEETLQQIDSLGDLDALCLLRWELLVACVTDDDWATFPRNN